MGRLANIEKEHEKQVQEAVRKLPIPSQICGDKELSTVASTIEDSQVPVGAIDDDQSVANLFSAQPTQDEGDEVMEVDTDQVAEGVFKKSTISFLISVAARIVVSFCPTANVQVAPEPKKKKSLAKPD